MKRSRGRFTTKNTEAGTSKKDSGSMNDRAHKALSEILDAAIATKNEDRIVEVSKLIANFKKTTPADADREAYRDFLTKTISLMSAEELDAYKAIRSEMEEILLRRAMLPARVAMRNGVQILWPENFPQAAIGHVLKTVAGSLSSSSTTETDESGSMEAL